MSDNYSVLELCAGAGGQALGLEQAGFNCIGAFDIEADVIETLKSNRKKWNAEVKDINNVSGWKYRGVDLVAGGVPCPPFSIAGKQLGVDDERDLFPAAVKIVKNANPKAIMLENVRGFLSPQFAQYRQELFAELRSYGYLVDMRLINASNYGVPQLRPRVIIIGLKRRYGKFFRWPRPVDKVTTIRDSILDLIVSNGWKGASAWAELVNEVAPTIVGGSKKHGGADLGPTRAKEKWKKLGVDGGGIANEPPSKDFPIHGKPKLTLSMVARLQGFPDDWVFTVGKTSAYRQIGNAFPPPVAKAIGASILNALNKEVIKLKENDQPSLFGTSDL